MCGMGCGGLPRRRAPVLAVGGMPGIAGRPGRRAWLSRYAGRGLRETSAVSRTTSSLAATYSPSESLGRLEVNDPCRDVGATTFTASRDPACGDAELLRRIGQGD